MENGSLVGARQTGTQGQVTRSFRNGSSVSYLEIRLVPRKPPKEKATQGKVPEREATGSNPNASRSDAQPKVRRPAVLRGLIPRGLVAEKLYFFDQAVNF